MVVCVLGMHRSGTSCVTGTLQAAGVFLGEVFTRSEHNFKGNRESGAIMALHNDLLAANGGRWDDPPPVTHWSDAHRRRRDEIISGLAAAAPLWGFKDPRTLLVLDGWLEVLAEPRFVGVIRHPEAVARSLHRRVGMPAEVARRLWRAYNRRLAGYQERFDVPIIRFDQPATELLAALHQLCSRLGLDATAAASFFDQDLRHHEAETAAWAGVPSSDRALYEQLAAAAL